MNRPNSDFIYEIIILFTIFTSSLNRQKSCVIAEKKYHVFEV